MMVVKNSVRRKGEGEKKKKRKKVPLYTGNPFICK